MPAEKEIGVRHPGENWRSHNVERTKPMGTTQVLDGQLRVTQVKVNPAAASPGRCTVQIEFEGLIDKSLSQFQVVDDVGKRESRLAKYKGIILGQLHSGAR